MRAFLFAIVIGMLACGDASADIDALKAPSGNRPTIDDNPITTIANNGFFRAPSPAAPPQLLFDYAPGVVGAVTHAIPPCSASALAAAGLPAGICAMQCTAHSSGAAWQCVDGTGASFTVTAGTGPVVANVWGGTSQQIYSDANAPTIASGSANALASLFASPHTTIWTGYGTSGLVTFPFQITDGTNMEYMRDEGGQTKCDWFNGTQTPTFVDVVDTSGIIIDHGYTMLTCRKAGTAGSSVYTTRINGNSTSSSAWAHDPATLTAPTVYFGRFSNASHYIGGEQESFTIYTSALSDTQLTARESAWRGTAPTTSATTDQLAFNGHDVFLPTSDGQYMPLGDNVTRVTNAGFYIEEGNASAGTGNNFATDGLDASSWTKVNAGGGHSTHPTVSTNVASGPFSRWKNTAEVDEFVDDDATTFEMLKGTTGLGVYTGHVTFSCFVRAGTTGVTTTKAHLVVTSTVGTGSTSCDFTGLTSTDTRLTCSTLIGGSPTDTRGFIGVGNATTDTGSIRVSECQLDPEGWAQTPHPSNRGIGVDDLSVTANEIAGYSHTAGSMQVIMTPDFTWANDEHLIENEYTYEIMDVFHTGRDDHRVLAWHYNYGLHLPAIANRNLDGDVNNMDTYASSDPNPVAGHTYAFKVAWTGVNTDRSNRWIYYNECTCSVATACTPTEIAACSATTLIGSDITGTKFRPTNDVWGGIELGCRYTRTLCFKGTIKRFSYWDKP